MRNKFLLISTLFLAYAILLSQSSEKQIKFEATTNKSSIKAGESFTAYLKYELNEHWYTYDIIEQISPEGIGPSPTEITITTDEFAVIDGKIKTPKPKEKFDEGFEMQIKYFKDKGIFEIPLKAKKDIINLSDVKIAVYLQLCDTTKCLPPEEYLVEVKYSELSQANPFVEEESDINKAKKGGILSFLWFAMTAGALALLTPCVFPMIPITVSFFTKRAEKTNSKAMRDSLVYAFGIMFTFTAIGFILSLLLGASGIRDFATNPWINLFIAAIFIIFAFNLFGAFEIQLPASMLNKLNNKSQGSGLTSVLLMGLTFSLTSFTCTVPFVGSALISASDGEWFYPIIGMIGFSGVFAAPFFLLALFPSAIKTLPKSGGWMNNIKVVMGFLEIAAALKFISNVDLVWAWGILPRDLFIAFWIGCGILIVLYILGTFRLSHDSPVEKLSALRVVFAVFFLGITIYLLPGLFQRPLGELDAFLPPAEYLGSNEVISDDMSNSSIAGVSTKPKFDDSDWLKNYEEALIQAKKEGKNVFIDFTGWTCTNCRWMEKNMFTHSDINDKMNQFIKVKLSTDRPNEEEQKNKQIQIDKFHSVDLPLYVIINPDEQVIGTKAFTRDKEEFTTFLNKGL